MDLSTLSDDPAVRLRQYQRARTADEERELVAGLLMLRDAGVKLEPHQEAAIAYSAWGTAAKSCGCKG